LLGFLVTLKTLIHSFMKCLILNKYLSIMILSEI
jgi:hypothetical protein